MGNRVTLGPTPPGLKDPVTRNTEAYVRRMAQASIRAAERALDDLEDSNPRSAATRLRDAVSFAKEAARLASHIREEG